MPPGGTFQGRPPRGRRDLDTESMEARWSAVSRCDRTAEVTGVDWLTRTGTLRLTFEVTDDRPFSFEPGNFVRIERAESDHGYQRGTYCIASPPSEYRRFELLVRVIPAGGMSQHLATLRLGDGIAFRGPTGRSMLRKATDTDLVLLATGVGVAPLYSLASTLLRTPNRRRIELYWGLRSPDDLCLTAELDRLAAAHQNFQYHISLSEPPDAWTGLRGRLTESVPPLLTDVLNRRYVLTGNGAMVDELSSALAEVGVARESMYEEPYFNGRYIADPAVVADIVQRFEPAEVGEGAGEDGGEVGGNVGG